MDKMLSPTNIPDVVLEAYDQLLQHRLVAITKPINLNLGEGIKSWEFECIAKVPYPNLKKIPQEVPLRVLISETFPREPIKVFSLCEKVSGFPHQDAESRKLCLREEHLAPRDASRLVCYVKWAIEWLKDATNGTLLKPGDPYELPDFSRKLLTSSLPIKYPLIFNESSNSYGKWKSHIGAFGDVECFFGEKIPAIFAVKFCDEDGSTIRASEFHPNVLNKESKIIGKWVILSDIRYERHRPPQTYKEIERLCLKNRLDFYAILKSAWNIDKVHQFGILLIGFPIPKIVGQPPVEIHWQPLLFKNFKWFKGQKTKQGSKLQSRKPTKIWQRLIKHDCFSLTQQLPWGKVENVTRERLYARGAHPSKVQSTPIAIFGCGALGSSVAELLARGGVNRLYLFDPDSIKFGNLCRHTLDGSTVGLNKACALAGRLVRTNPLSTIMGYPVGIPLNSRVRHVHEEIHPVLADTDVLVDCTTSDTAFDWLNQYAKENDKRLVSLFFNFHAELLTLCISNESMSCGEIFKDLIRSIQQPQTPLDPKIYFSLPSKEEQVIEGAGCWHPSFPALNSHVQILAAYAIDILNHYINEKKIGLATIVRRQSFPQNCVHPSALIEVVWKKEYPPINLR